jgi:hypothetical protein
MVLWGLSNEILWPHSVESSSCFRLIEQVSDELVVVLLVRFLCCRYKGEPGTTDYVRQTGLSMMIAPKAVF